MRKTRALVIGAVAAFVLVGAFTAQADKELGGKAWLRAMSTKQQAVIIGKTVYHLNGRTRIKGMKGQTIGLSGLEGVPDFEALVRVPRSPKLWVSFDATRVAGRLELNWMEVESGTETMAPVPARRSER